MSPPNGWGFVRNLTSRGARSMNNSRTVAHSTCGGSPNMRGTGSDRNQGSSLSRSRAYQQQLGRVYVARLNTQHAEAQTRRLTGRGAA